MADHPNKHIREALKYAEERGYRFRVIVPTPQMTHDETLDATEVLAKAGCTDASIRGHVDGMELWFERASDS